LNDGGGTYGDRGRRAVPGEPFPRKARGVRFLRNCARWFFRCAWAITRRGKPLFFGPRGLMGGSEGQKMFCRWGGQPDFPFVSPALAATQIWRADRGNFFFLFYEKQLDKGRGLGSGALGRRKEKKTRGGGKDDWKRFSARAKIFPNFLIGRFFSDKGGPVGQLRLEGPIFRFLKKIDKRRTPWKKKTLEDPQSPPTHMTEIFVTRSRYSRESRFG